MAREKSCDARRDRKAWVGLYVRGIAMGIAETVPGVSGGTIAFISGIYDELIRSLASLRPTALLALPQGFARFWHTHNLGFLTVLGLGMVTGIALFAQLLGYWLEVARPVVWAFFLGVISLSVLLLGKARTRRSLLLIAPLGLALGLLVVRLEPMQAADGLWVYFVGGALAVCAWLLPAVSGSFLLLVLGLYESVLHALGHLEWTILASLVAGCACGLIAFANLLHWLMQNHREPVLSLLTGFLVGSLTRLWPWSVQGQLMLPADYTQATGLESLLLPVFAAFAAGLICLYLLTRLE